MQLVISADNSFIPGKIAETDEAMMMLSHHLKMQEKGVRELQSLRRW